MMCRSACHTLKDHLDGAPGDEDSSQGAFHTNFKLAASGEEIGLYDADAKANMRIDTVVFGSQVVDVSYGCCPDGSDTYGELSFPTPGDTNASCGAGVTGWDVY